MSMKVPVNEPVITDAAKKYVNEALDTGWISSAGIFIERFEDAFAKFIGTKHAITVSNGTTSLHLALASVGVGPGDEVIVPDFTIAACSNAILYTGATPVFADVTPDVFTIDPNHVEKLITDKTKVIMPVHMYGHSVDVDPIMELADKHNLIVLEDAAEVHGATYHGKNCGSIGHMASFSFYANKIITTGEGGMIVTDDDQIAEQARLLKNLAHSPGKRFWHEQVGFNYRLTNIQAAIGLGQLENVEEFLKHRQWYAAEYSKRLKYVPHIMLPQTREGVKNVYWMYSILVNEDAPFTRDQLCDALRAKGVDTRTFFISLSSQPINQQFKAQGTCPVSESISDRGFYLPSGLALTAEQLEYSAEQLIACVKELS